jgi:cytochrome P450
MNHSSLLAIIAFASCVITLLARYLLTSHKARRLPLPPGPKTSWLGGVQLPRTHQWLTYAKWKDTFGDIIYIYTFGNPIIVLNTAEAADELLDKRGNIYSSKPVRTMVYELMGWDWVLSLMPYGPRWRRHRAKFQKHFHINLSPVYHPIQVQESHMLLRNLLTNSDNFNQHIRRAAAAIVLKVAYGYDVADEHDSYIALANAALQTFSQASVFGAFLVDYIPMLKYVPSWMPGASFKRKACEWRNLSHEMLESQFKIVKQNMANGTAVSCIATRELEHWKESGQSADEEELIKDVAAVAYGGGADTTVSAISSFFLAMVLSPGVQKKAQNEIDRVTAGSRLPSFVDKSSLPYISCIVWECLRWNPVAPMGGAHSLTEDNEYNGYRIPKGSTVLPNVWAILHDEHTYPEPLEFNPERFENKEKNKLAGINELPQAAFGFGRRMCPGRWLAYDSIWIAVAAVLSVYDIFAATDPDGGPIQPSVEYTSGSLSHPKPFKCRIVPRSDAAAALIKQTVEEKA